MDSGGSSFLDRLAEGEVLLADGAIGSLLMRHGLEMGQAPERINLERPELLREMAAAYLDAGAQILQTNTFGGSPLKLAPYGLAERTVQIQQAAVGAVRDAIAAANRTTDRARESAGGPIAGGDAERARRGGVVYISGSCGPCGRMLEPYGDVSPAEVREGFERQLGALIDAGADILCIETMTDLQEARLAVEAARRAMAAVPCRVPVMASMTFDATPRGFFTMMGQDIATCAAALVEAGADIVGSNCGNGIANMVKIAQELRAVTDRPLLIQSNAGLPELEGDRAVYPEDPAFMAGHIPALCDAGVQVIGGCCGTTPDHIRAFRRVLDERAS